MQPVEDLLAPERVVSNLVNTLTRVVTYPVLEDAKPSLNYTAKVNGVETYVDFHSGFSGGDISWLSLNFEGSVEISVTALRNVKSVTVCPISAGIVARLDGNTATITLHKPCRLFLKWNDDFELPFHIFANSLETDFPAENTEHVRYFGPGQHHPGMIHLKSEESLYLAAGAFVCGTVEAENAQNVKIYGRGILCASHLNRNSKETYVSHGCPNEVIGFRNCKNIQVEGITILDSHHWTLVLRNCDHAHISNVKIFGERNFSTDGFNPVNSRDVLIEDCFARCKDDCVTIKGLDDQYPGITAPIRNIVVQNCVFWSDNNNGVVVGSETKAKNISDIIFRNIDFLRVTNTCGDYAGAMSIICLHDTDIRNIRFEDIRIEYCTGPYFNFFFCDSIFRIPGLRQPEGGTLRDIVLKNISVTGGPFRSSYITGYDELRLIENVSIENLCIHGKKITNAQEGDVVVNRFTRNIQFTCP